MKIILKNEYGSYEDSLEKLKLQNLSERREMLAARFANKCANDERFNDLFPLNCEMNLRDVEKYKVKFATTGRLQKSSIPAMQKLLNKQS